VEILHRRYLAGIVWLAAAFVLLPLTGWVLVAAARVPYATTAAKFIALVPQAVIAPTLFKVAKQRFTA
jgi:hypothetical protein